MDDLITDSSPRYIRKGNCNRCGWCCKHENCKYLEIKNGIAVCLIHDSPDRPLKCVIFPSAPPILHKECGYSFIDIWEGNKIVKEIV